MTNGSAIGPADGPALLRSAITYALGPLAQVTESDLGRPTPCARWDLRALLDHIAESHDALCEAATLGSVALARSRPAAGVSPRALCADLDRLRATWEDTAAGLEVRVEGVPLSVGVTALTGAVEFAVHGWDVGKTCGLSPPLPTPLARDLLCVAPLVASGIDRDDLFAPAIPLPATASAADQLLAYLGRRPD